MERASVEFLQKLCDAISPSGFEEDAAKIWQERTKEFVDEIRTDVHGNSIAVLNKDGKPRVMLAGHIDEIGYMVKYIDDKGFIFFRPIGGIDRHLVPGERVWIKTKEGIITGAIGRKPIHAMDEKEREKLLKFHQMWVDIGAKDKETARKLVKIGDPAVPAVKFEELREDRVIGRGFDDKSGAFVVSETLRLLASRKISASVYGVATVQEEIGLRGAKTSAFGIHPDIGIAIDVTLATDYPAMEESKKMIGEIKVGGGPVISRGPNINPKVFDLLIETAEELKIPYQIEAQERGTPTDANVIQLTREGIATGLVSIPTRYIHTPVELLSLNDLENTAKLLAEFIVRLAPDIQLVPF